MREAKENQTQERWQGGDDQDRLDYIKEQKAKLGFGLERMLSLSNKRMPSGHYLKDDPSYIEFTDVRKNREIVKGLLQPGDMQWSVDHLLDKMDDMIDLGRERMNAETKVRYDELQVALDKINQEFEGIWKVEEGERPLT